MTWLIGLIGALCILIGYAMIVVGEWKAEGYKYLLINLVGTGLLSAYDMINGPTWFLLLQAAFFSITFWKIIFKLAMRE